jgi:hypothetical protein
MGAPGGYFGRFGGSSSDDDNMVVGTSDSSIQQMGINAGLKPQNVRTFSLAQIPKEPKAVTPYYKE